ncbi:hypothetical protein KUM39_19375 [Streptomyces sp. J2-1]|uniref:hypothetical protein n=1 Tax=Streptomyces corallincola TaxID=2851888 RepID=UPI001C394E1C|nr:hypothetical protein [Streptomyces corallincola]MBV2356513.1 hypothetical protein [Streptomyces corallincola]
MALNSARWQGGWAETASELHTTQLIVLPLTVAAGCWQGGRERRRRTGELWATAARAPLARLLVSALPVAVWTALGFLAATVSAMLATWPYTQGDTPHLGLLPGDVVTTAGVALVGHVVGRVVPWRLTGPVLAVALFAWLSTILVDAGGPSRLTPARPVGDDLLPVWWQPLAVIGWTGGLTAAAVLAYAARRRITALLPLAVAAAAALALTTSTEVPYRTDPLALRQVCDTSTTPAVCVNARYAGVLPQVRAALAPVTEKLEGVRGLPARWEDLPGSTDRDEAQLPILTPRGWSFVRGRLTHPRQYAWEAVAMLEGGDRCEKRGTRTTDELVEHYLAPSPVEADFDRLDARGTKADRAALRRTLAVRARFAALSPEARRTWLSGYFIAARSGACSDPEVPLP